MEEQQGIWQNPEDYGDYDPDMHMSGNVPGTAKSSKSGRRNRSMGSDFSGGGKSPNKNAPKSSMIDKEMQQLEKIKQRQQKEIEAMMENERK